MNKRSAVFLALLAGFLPVPAHALSIPQNFCSIGAAFGLSVNCAATGVQGLSDYAADFGINTVGVVFLAVLMAMFFTFAIRLIVGSNDENTIREAKVGYAHAITGAAIVSLASLFVWAFSPDPAFGPGAELVDKCPVQLGFVNAITYFRIILGGAMLINIVIQGARLIAAQSQEDAEKAKKRLLYGFVGVGIILLANRMVLAVFPDTVPCSSGGVSGSGGDSSIISIEMVGIANFLLAAFGLMVVVAIIIAGIYLVVSVKEDNKEKAKQIIKTSIIALAVIIAAFAIVNAFLFLGVSGPTGPVT